VAVSLFLVEETGENYRPVAGHQQVLSHNVISSTPRRERGSLPIYICDTCMLNLSISKGGGVVVVIVR
jgi:hypothetical protein